MDGETAVQVQGGWRKERLVGYAADTFTRTLMHTARAHTQSLTHSHTHTHTHTHHTQTHPAHSMIIPKVNLERTSNGHPDNDRSPICASDTKVRILIKLNILLTLIVLLSPLTLLTLIISITQITNRLWMSILTLSPRHYFNSPLASLITLYRPILF